MLKKRTLIIIGMLCLVFFLCVVIVNYVNYRDEQHKKQSLQYIQESNELEQTDERNVVIETVSAFYVPVGTATCEKEDLLEHVKVRDKNGEEADTKISIELPWFQTEKEGQYLATFTVTDSFGAVTTKKVPVYVLDGGAVTEHILKNKECDASFSYEILCDDTGQQIESLSVNNIKAVSELSNASAVSFSFLSEDGGSGYGNGFVIDLTEQAVYIASNYHVIYVFDTKAEICFADGSKVTDYDILGGNKNADVAFIKINRESLSEECFTMLMEPAISLVRAKTMQDGEPLIRSSLSKDGSMQYEEGTFLEYDYELYNGNHYTTFTTTMSEGNSGSPVYDGCGNLISMCAGIGTEDGLEIMCGVKLEDIITNFEEVTGHSLYAY